MHLFNRLSIIFIFCFGLLLSCTPAQKEEKPLLEDEINEQTSFILSVTKGDLKESWSQTFYEFAQKDKNLAASNLGSCPFRTNIITPQYTLTVQLLEKAALQNKNAQLDLGLIYYCNIYYDGDVNKALKYFHPLAMAGIVTAQIKMGEIYFSSFIIEKNIKFFVEAEKWFKEAAKAGSTSALYGLAMLNGSNDNHKQANHYSKLAADKGDPQSQAMMAAMHIYGAYGNHKDYSKAKLWLDKVDVGANVYESKFLLMMINHIGGYGIIRNQEEANKILKELAEDLLPSNLNQFIKSLSKDKLEKLVNQLSKHFINDCYMPISRIKARIESIRIIIEALERVDNIETNYMEIKIKDKNS